MKNKKYAIIHNTEAHNWKSCEELEISLYCSYESIFKNQASYIDLADNINVTLPNNTTYIIITHKLTAALQKALEQRSEKSKIEIIWHVFGNLANLFISTPSLETVLKKFTVKFVVASSAQARRVKSYLNNIQEDSIETVWFGADTDTFHVVDEDQISSIRKKYSLKPQDYVFCYAGRLSFQKNISFLLKAFVKVAKSDERAHLLFCGNFDDIGFTELGLRLGANAYQSELMRYIDALPIKIKKRILFVGNLEKKELADILAASDLFISMSTYILEDFGLSPVQALLAGTPVLLTEWGGYTDLKESFKNYVDLINVKMQDNDLYLDEFAIVNTINKHLANKLNPLEREELSKKAKEIYSVNGLKKRLESLLSKEFKGNHFSFNHESVKDFNPKANKLHLSIKFTPAVLSHVKNYVGRETHSFDKNSFYSILNDWNEFIKKINQHNLKVAPLEKQDLALHWPAFRQFNDRYSSVYAFQIDSLKALQDHDYVLLRDGFIGITAFFSLFPNPSKNLKVRICINLKLRKLIDIPNAWKDNVAWYAYEYKNQSIKATCEKALIFIINNPLKLTEEIVYEVQSFSYRNYYYVNGENFINSEEKLFLKNSEIQFLSWGVFLNMQNFSQYDFIDYGDIGLSTKNFSEDFILDRGGRMKSIIKEKSFPELMTYKSVQASPFRMISIFYEKG